MIFVLIMLAALGVLFCIPWLRRWWHRRAVRRRPVSPPPPPPRPLDELIAELVRGAWTSVYVPDRDNPSAVAWSRYVGHTGDVVDVIQLLDVAPGGAFAYRATITLGDDVLDPPGPLDWYVWDCEASWVIEQALALPEPGRDGAPKLALLRPPIADVLPGLLADARRHVIRPPQHPGPPRPGGTA
ncbi:hypothetical protein [Saccharothrix texasensis]|uniref:Uncharacterized protein n=1 Tax=Saccharothrix texasensis TaxID=103734 RepID=A0A3N1H189_9PSEU|nr:hypothetical protein [Saccharothrix texasensis]ROP36303.1 hypothetical protein EDD40_1568 [Saccharothrix texasensis]